MELQHINASKKVALSDDVFGYDFNESLIHQVVRAYLAAGRAGTKAQKNRSAVSGGGAKPFKQKGTGRARAGTIRSPIWRTGGVTFAASTRSFKQKVNKRMYRGAICSILSELIRQDRVKIVESIEIAEAKTKLLAAYLKDNKVEGNTLIVVESPSDALYLAARNLPKVQVVEPSEVVTNPPALVGAESVLMTEAAIKKIEGLLQ